MSLITRIARIVGTVKELIFIYNYIQSDPSALYVVLRSIHTDPMMRSDPIIAARRICKHLEFLLLERFPQRCSIEIGEGHIQDKYVVIGYIWPESIGQEFQLKAIAQFPKDGDCWVAINAFDARRTS